MNIVELYLGELLPYAKNPRNNEKAVDTVANSIKEFGFKVPIIVDKENIIVAGHTRYLAAKKLGMEKVPCIIANDLSEKQIKAFRLADNKVAEQATWDYKLLNEELDDLLNLDFEMADFGFVGEADGESFIDDLLENEYAGSEVAKEHFQSTFVFPIQYEEVFNAYVKEHGKESLVALMIKEVNQ